MGTKAYLIGQGYDNLKKHGGKTLSTMLIICATMFILGIFIIAFVNIEQNIKTVTQNQGLQAFISDDIAESEIEPLAIKIKQIENVKTIRYVDKAAAFEDAKSTLKDYEYLLNGLEAINPFPRSFIVVFNKLSSTKQVKEAIESVDGIYKVGYNEKVIDAVTSISKIGNVIILGVGTIMILISVFIISNTIKLAVYSNKREIYIMKYIGATSQFIKAPFIVEGVIMGLASAILSWVVVSLGYILMYTRLPKIGESLGVFGFVGYSNFWYIMLIAFILLGIILGGFGSSIATMKYLKEFKPIKIKSNSDDKDKKNKDREVKVKKQEAKLEKEKQKRESKEKKSSEKQQQEEILNKRRARRLSVIILAIAISITPLFNIVYAANTKQEIKEIKEMQAEVVAKFEKVESDINIYEKAITDLDKEVTKYSGEVDKLSSKVKTINADVTALESELQSVSTNYEATSDLLNTRLRALYENGFVNFWEVLFSSKDTTDFLAKYNVLVTLIEYDKNMLTAMQSKKEYINSLKESAELRKLQVQQVEYDVQKSKEALEIAKSTKVTKLSKLESSKQELSDLKAKLKKDLDAKEKKLAEELAAANKNYSGVFTGNFAWPVEGVAKLTTYFGEVYNPFGTGSRSHYWGIDLARSKSYTTHIYSVADGKVTKVGWDSDGWGNYVIVSHGTNSSDGATYVSQYSHLKSVSVSVNQYVSKGQVVGIMGTTGASTGTHLDLILRRNNVYVNPLKYIDHKTSDGVYFSAP